MKKTKFFVERTYFELEQKVNEFIQSKEIISISYSVATSGIITSHCCCVLYTEKE